jgi:dTDP-4-amino-4,6-dideoxygalactose transaminase
MNPLKDYKLTYQFGYNEEEIKLVTEVLRNNNWVWSRDQTKLLEKEFCDYFGVKYAIPVSTGSMGLLCALAALRVGHGDEVITVANTFPAVPMYIISLGAKPILVDIEEESLNIDTNLVEEKITSKTKALMPVHSAGHPFDIEPIRELAEKYDLPLIHDAAQSMGAKYKGKFLGTFPDVTVFSFAVHKHVCVNGGIILTNNEEFQNEIWAKRFQGIKRDEKSYENLKTWGYSVRMLEIIAAIARVQFRKFREGPQRVEVRRSIARLYDNLLNDLSEIKTPIEKEWAYHSYCRYIVRAKRRDDLYNHLHKKGIEVFKHYETPLHMHPYMIDIYGNQEGVYPITEKTSKEVLTLPSWPYQTAQEIDYTIKAIKEFYK